MLDPLISGNEEIFSLSSPHTSTFLLDLNSRAKVLIRPAFKRQTDLTSKIILGDDITAETVTPTPEEMPVASSSSNPSPPRKESALPPHKFRKLEGRIEKTKIPFPFKKCTPLPPLSPTSPSPLSTTSKIYFPFKVKARSKRPLSPPPSPRALQTQPTPPSRASSASSTSSVYSEDITNCPCNTRKDYDCKRCRILRLAESFCNLVETKCELLTPPPTPGALSPTHL